MAGLLLDCSSALQSASALASTQHTARPSSIRSKRCDTSSYCCLWRRFRDDQVFRCHDLPASVAPNPCVGPNKASALTVVSLPGFVSLRNRCVGVEPYFHIIEVIRDKIFWRVVSLRHHFGFSVLPSFRVHADEVIGEDALNHGRVATCD